VDSGNLLGCLLALKQGLRDKIEEAIPEPGLVDGLRDTLSLAQEEFQALAPPPMPEPLDVFNRVAGAFQEISQHLDERLGDLAVREAWLQQMDQRAAQLHRDVERLAVALNEPPEDLQRWTQYFAEQIRDQRNELAALAPWLNLLRNEPGPLNMSAKENGAGQRWYNVWQCLLRVDSLAEMQAQIDEALSDLAKLEEMEGKAKPESAADSGRYAASTISQAVRASACAELLERCQRLADRAAAFAAAMEFRMLYNESRQIFSIGFNLALNRLDNAHYDLLASESCLTSFLAIARSEVPKRHWFHLARPLTRVAGGITLLSWGGTTFEYLMPRLLLRGYAGTLLQESWNTAVARQIDYGRQHRVPWGISESGFSALDVHLDYQYQSFGVPGLGLKRGLGQNLVIAPYATALALGIQPHEALENLERLQGQGVEGPYGFYEAIDYTRDRLVEKRRAAVVRSYMAHHQGMSLVAMANCLLQDIMVRRFHNEPIVRATELLLQERMPSSAPLQSVHGDEASPRPVDAFQPHAMSRRVTTADTPHPRTHLLSNRKYSVMVTNAGSGYSIWEDIDVTRWREDRTRDAFGQFCYVRDLRSGLLWSAGYQPVCRPADQYEAVFSTDKAEFRRFDGGIETHLEITVSAENAAEVRRITLTNHNTRPHELELTSYAEIVLGAHAADLAHPAFGKLFLETEFVSQRNALLCRKRPRSPEQKPIWAVHVLAVDGRALGTVQFETDRARFLGRGRTPANPVALERNVGLSGSTGPVLDPIFSLRRRLQLGPGASMAVAFSTAVAESREQALALADQYHDFHGVNRAFEMAWAHTQVELRHLRISAEHLHLYQRLAAHVIYAGQALRVPNAVANNRQGQPGLWKFGISGDKPIVVARVSEINELGLVRQLLEAHSYWHMKGLVVDLVLLNEHPASYSEELHEELMNMVRASEAHTLIDRPGGVFVRKAAQMSDEDRLLLQAAARVVLIGSRGSLAGQVDRFERTATLPDRLTPSERRADRERGRERALRPPADLLFPNGLGGFTSDGREYVITIERRAWGPMPSQLPGAAAPRGAPESLQLPPAPWINVIANPNCGFLISESGAGYTWAGNSQANRLTPWHNDPVSDTPGEVIYLRDDDTGEFWTPTPAPVPPEATTVVRHGQGYTYFDQQSHGLSQELLLFVPPDDPIKLCRLRIRNLGTRERRLSTIYYVEWVLGMVRDQAALNVVPSVDPETGAQLARNAFNTDFAQQIGFADVSLRPCTCTADRTEFLGRNGSVAAPAALGRVELSGKIEPTLDPCAAMMAPFVIGPGEDIEIVFFLGAAARQEDVRRLLRRYRDPLEVEKAFKEACRRWERTLTTVQVRTPNPALDLLLNRWLLYQVLSCRLWARSAFYQSGGAYGFRDQLQDVMALVHGAPQEERAQILRAAARQFVEGDVQHWWHPPSGRGTRTHFSDDLLWLPLVACHYVNTTGDTGILDEKAPFLKGPVLAPDQEEAYFAPAISEETATLYEHCLRALEHGMRFGSHGLPLMGTGDWNDGMNRVGAGGKGESVWNGWFLLTILKRFVPIAEARGDTEHAARYREQMERLRAAMEASAWDGRWYRRAYFDDGTPLGSEQNDECKIDSLPQSWAVISGAADPERARQAMAAVEEFLVKEADKMILLFTPPFDQGKLQPGYIKGYVPGIRENGGQYTHAASWVVQATTLLGHGQRAIELFDLINPILHAATPEDVQHYKVEPYVVVGDIYGHPPHVGRGGWTWYTGSAGWLYRVGLENILGFRREANRLYVDPCIASRWPKFEITYRFGSATYHVTVENPRSVERGVHSVAVDGKGVEGKSIELKDDGQKHEVRVILGN
jgi:cyclic beta-1,2-glucan synthetase